MSGIYDKVSNVKLSFDYEEERIEVPIHLRDIELKKTFTEWPIVHLHLYSIVTDMKEVNLINKIFYDAIREKANA